MEQFLNNLFLNLDPQSASLLIDRYQQRVRHARILCSLRLLAQHGRAARHPRGERQLPSLHHRHLQHDW